MLIAVAASDPRFRAQLAGLLESNGHKVVEAEARPEALADLRAAAPHLLVVASAADGAAAAFIRALRAQPDMRLLPVLCVDPKAGSSDTVALLDAGADDAITRPFQPPIFLARVRTLLRRVVWAGDAPEETVTVLIGGPIELKLVSRQALVVGKAVELTRLEFDLLAHLLKHPDRAFKREELLASVWNYPGNVETRTLDKHVESLRRKVGSCAPLIQTVHGVGYRFNPGDAVRR
ncbi:MAG: response regulator transcription factor [Elusimicrobia bacterium]|nr:response regulator transcription factor [Elusimicrobiota bacterium]